MNAKMILFSLHLYGHNDGAEPTPISVSYAFKVLFSLRIHTTRGIRALFRLGHQNSLLDFEQCVKPDPYKQIISDSTITAFYWLYSARIFLSYAIYYFPFQLAHVFT